MISVIMMVKHITVGGLIINDKTLTGIKFGESAKKSIWQKKVW